MWSRVGERTRSLLAAGLRALGPPLGPDYYEQLEELLLGADVGPAMAAKLVQLVRARSPHTADEARDALVAGATSVMSKRSRDLVLEPPPACILLYGVNGAGKTTTAAKLAHFLLRVGRRPLIVAADTYRAAGIDQMVQWARRAGVPSFAGAPGADPASVVFDGVQQARRLGHDVVVADTAGRLQSQRNLLQELAKLGRVTSRALEGSALESLLVLDATLGLSSLTQAAAFNEAIPMTGLVLAKLDGTAKGGAVVGIEGALGVPVKLAGVGEGLDDLAPFDAPAYIRSLVQD
ncbi:MAG TPA: signal recognition particle-docking protein FtsY [Candidatus Dormibacteraeota bacterium]|nr:signal recognition particle-docking protein FtsY [Candidatus Dormibacteraeota bacterium]